MKWNDEMKWMKMNSSVMCPCSPSTDVAFSLWTATDRRWMRYSPNLASPDSEAILRSMSFISDSEWGPTAPRVSMATGGSLGGPCTSPFCPLPAQRPSLGARWHGEQRCLGKWRPKQAAYLTPKGPASCHLASSHLPSLTTPTQEKSTQQPICMLILKSGPLLAITIGITYYIVFD